MRERIQRIIVPRPPEEMPPPDEFVLRLIQETMVGRKLDAILRVLTEALRPAPAVPAPPVAPPTVVVRPPFPPVPPPEEARAPVVPLYYEEDLATGTVSKRIDLGIRARYINIRTDEDISIRLDKTRLPIPIPAAESPFTLWLPPKNWTEKVWVTALSGAMFKMITAIEPIAVSFGRATTRRAPTTGDWHWQVGVDVDAGSDDTYSVIGANGEPYTVPIGKRFILEHTHVSCEAAGEVQRFDVYDYDPITLRAFRFASTFFDIELQRTVNYALGPGHQLIIHLYNNNRVARHFQITLHGYEEAL